MSGMSRDLASSSISWATRSSPTQSTPQLSTASSNATTTIPSLGTTAIKQVKQAIRAEVAVSQVSEVQRPKTNSPPAPDSQTSDAEEIADYIAFLEGADITLTKLQRNFEMQESQQSLSGDKNNDFDAVLTCMEDVLRVKMAREKALSGEARAGTMKRCFGKIRRALGG